MSPIGLKASLLTDGQTFIPVYIPCTFLPLLPLSTLQMMSTEHLLPRVEVLPIVTALFAIECWLDGQVVDQHHQSIAWLVSRQCDQGLGAVVGLVPNIDAAILVGQHHQGGLLLALVLHLLQQDVKAGRVVDHEVGIEGDYLCEA